MAVLHLAVRTDIPLGRQASQLVHAAFEWAEAHGAHHDVVVIHAASSENALMMAQPETGRIVVWREPDLRNQPTAFATDRDVDLPLLGK